MRIRLPHWRRRALSRRSSSSWSRSEYSIPALQRLSRSQVQERSALVQHEWRVEGAGAWSLWLLRRCACTGWVVVVAGEAGSRCSCEMVHLREWRLARHRRAREALGRRHGRRLAAAAFYDVLGMSVVPSNHRTAGLLCSSGGFCCGVVARPMSPMRPWLGDWRTRIRPGPLGVVWVQCQLQMMFISAICHLARRRRLDRRLPANM